MKAGLTEKVIVQQLPGRRFEKNTLGSSSLLLSTAEYVHCTVCSDMATYFISCLFVPVRQPKNMYKRPHNRRLKHFSLVWQFLRHGMYMKILRGPFREQLGNLSSRGGTT
jgi:hypothetical protein